MAKKRDVLRETLHQVGQEVQGAKTKEALTPERIALAYARLFDGEDGAIVEADIRERFNGTTVRFRPNGIDPFEVVLREGERRLYLYIVEMKTPPPSFITETEETDA